MYYYTYDMLDLDPDLSEKFLCNFVNSAHTDMYDTSKASFAQELHFFFLHLRALSDLWGRYDPKLKKISCFLVTESFLHIESCVMPLYKALNKGFISFCTATRFDQYMRTL